MRNLRMQSKKIKIRRGETIEVEVFNPVSGEPGLTEFKGPLTLTVWQTRTDKGGKS